MILVPAVGGVAVAEPRVAATLELGALDLLGNDRSAGWWIEASGDDADFGTPVAVEQAIASFLMDGAIAVTQGYDNREMKLKLALYGTTPANLALAEQALMAEVARRNLLTWTPPSKTVAGAAAACVFEVVNSSLSPAFSDLDELNEIAVYTIDIKALPFARSQSVAADFSPPPPTSLPTVEPIDNCSSLTGWSATSSYGSPSLVVENGTLVRAIESYPKGTATQWLRLARFGLSAPLASTPYVRVKLSHLFAGTGPVLVAVQALCNGIAVGQVARDGDYVWFQPPVATLTSFQVIVHAQFPISAGSIFLRVEDISRTSTTSLSSTAGQRQTFRSFAIKGSTRAQGNITITDTSATPVGLGTTLVHTTPNHLSGFQPDLRRRMVPGPATTIDTATVSGVTSNLSTAHSFDIVPPPSSAYVLMARLKHSAMGSYNVTWTASSRVGTNTVGTDQSGVQAVSLTAGVWGVQPVALMVLPTTAISDDVAAGSTVRVTLSGPAGLLLDEAWLFDVANGRLTWVECGTGTATPGGPSSVLAMSAATLTNPVPTIMRGDATALYGAGSSAQSFGAHEFVPPSINVFLVTTGSVQPRVDISYFPSFFSRVVDPDTSP